MTANDAQAPRVGAVVVFYHPDAACVARANRLAAALRCVVVDNTPDAAVDVGTRPAGLSADVVYLRNGDNLGIATALNQGIERLIGDGCDAALLFDQDSEPPAALLTELPALMTRLVEAGERVAVLGPAYDDARLGGVAPFVRFRPFRLERIAPAGDAPIDVDFLITSGSCINLRCLAAVGAMDDALFIDFVDVEWCVRAKRAGYRVLGVPWLTMTHALGDEPVKVLGRRYPMHSAVRHYYLFRNAVALIRRGYMPWTWKSTELMKLPVRLLVYAMLPHGRGEHLRMALRGARDGWGRRLGRMPAR